MNGGKFTKFTKLKPRENLALYSNNRVLEHKGEAINHLVAHSNMCLSSLLHADFNQIFPTYWNPPVRAL